MVYALIATNLYVVRHRVALENEQYNTNVLHVKPLLKQAQTVTTCLPQNHYMASRSIP